MTEKSPSEDDKLPEAEAEERFRRGIANALATPPKPHKPGLKGRSNRQATRRTTGKMA